MTEERVVTVSGKETEGATRTWVVDTGGETGLVASSSGVRLPVQLVVAVSLPASLRPVDPPVQRRTGALEPTQQATAAEDLSGGPLLRVTFLSRLEGVGVLGGLGDFGRRVLSRLL